VAGGFQLQGGSGFQPRTAEHYQATRDQWTDTPDPPFTVAALTGIRDGRVLAVGNRPGGRPILRPALFQERTSNWTDAQPLDVEWFEPILTPLSDGRVLATGGFALGPTSSAALFDPQLAAPAAATQNGSSMGTIPWQLILVALVLGGAAYASYRRPRVWAYTRPLFSGAFQIAGLFALTWGLVHIAGLESPPISSPTVAGAIRPAESALLQLPLPDLLRATTSLSLTLAGLAACWATAAGAGGALFVVSLRRRYWEAATAAAALLWVAPTFLLAILVQELQAFIYGHSGLVVAAGFGDVSPQQLFWASIVLGLRPAAYLYRHTRDALEVELRQDYPRTAMAKGLSWRQAITSHVLRAAAAGLTAPWLNAFRLMIGALPLVEFFFGYPGVGRVLILALGLTYNGVQGAVREDVIVALVVTMGVLLVAAEAAVAVLRRALDPRLRELRPA
jgi:ABC-type dipeptide/oligopeptide/nickel transport system permease component